MATCVPHPPTLWETSELHSKVLTTSDLLRVFSTPRLSPFRRLQFWTWSSNNKSFLIFVDSYATPSSSLSARTVTDFHACNSNQPAPVITVVTTNQDVQIMQLRESCPCLSASMLTTTIRYKNSSTPRGKGDFLLSRAHTTPAPIRPRLTISLCQFVVSIY